MSQPELPETPHVERPLRGQGESIKPAVLIHTTTESTVDGQQEPNTCTTFQIYKRRKGAGHFLITPEVHPGRESFWPQVPKRKKSTSQREKTSDAYDECSNPEAFDHEASATQYFLHSPTLYFHNPPRTLRLGDSRSSPTVCILHNSLFWRKWCIQFGPQLSSPGVIDGRGIVSLQHDWANSLEPSTAKLDAPPTALKGYRLHTRRFLGESGKAWFKEEAARRRNLSHAGQAEPQLPGTKPAAAEGAVHLTWTSPFSFRARQYHFKCYGIDFFWKGTGTVKDSHWCGPCVRFHHLKLVAQTPLNGDDKSTGNDQDICLARFTCSVKAGKAGVLELFDDPIRRCSASNDSSVTETCSAPPNDQLRHLIVATAMCMTIAEKQKRDTIRAIILSAASEGGGAGG